MEIQSPFGQRPWMTDSGAAIAVHPTVHPNHPHHHAVKGIIAGGITGGIETIVTYPTEYVKTHLQLDGKGAKKKYGGIIDCIRKTIDQKGYSGLYRGLSVLIYGSIPRTAVRFGSFEMLRDRMADDSGKLSASGKLLSGLGAGICEGILTVVPMETIKVKIINDERSLQPKFKGFTHGIKTIIKTEGIAGIYQGVTATVLKQGTSQSIRFGVMEYLKDLYLGNDRTQHIPIGILGIFGAIAGAAPVIANTPLDVIKTRMQGLEANQYKNTLDCIKQIWTNEGFLAFYKGTVPRLIRVCVGVGVTFIIYDSFMEVFDAIWD